jgi:hypothetical protein
MSTPSHSSTREKLSTVAESVLRRYFDKKENGREFVGQLCAACLLCGTDYVKNYCKGIHCRKGPLDRSFFSLNGDYGDGTRSKTTKEKIGIALDQLTEVPWVIYVFLKYYEEFSEMISIDRKDGKEYIRPSERAKDTALVDIDENKFIEFTHRVYVECYAMEGSRGSKAFAKKYGDQKTIENVRKHLYDDKLAELQIKKKKNTGKNYKPPIDETKILQKLKTNRVPPKRKIRVSARHLLWQMEYMMNSYKGLGHIDDPTLLYLELPYYGWIIDNQTNKCKVTSRVSLKRPNLREDKKKAIKNSREKLLKALKNAETK